jgi:hypothetical protein
LRSPGALYGLGWKVEVERIIALLEEGPLAPIAALGHVMREAGNDDAGQASHDGSTSTGVKGLSKLSP